MKAKMFGPGLLIALCCATLLSALILSACGGSAQPDSNSQDDELQAQYALVHPGCLTVATCPDYEPMEYLEGGEIKGYDIALIKEVANRLGLAADIQSKTFDSLVPHVASGKTFDCSISAITINAERAQEVAFTDAYYDSNLAIVVLNDTDVTSKDQLNGQPVGAQSGTTGEEWVKANLPNSDRTPFQETTDMLAALRTGQIKAIVLDEPVARDSISDEYADCQILEVIYTGEQYGIIVNADNVALASAINSILEEMNADGTIAKLRAEWFGDK